MAGANGRHVEHVPDAGEGGQRVGRHRVEPVGRVAEPLGHGPPELEVEVAIGIAGDVAVHGADVAAQLGGVDEVLCLCGHRVS